MSSIPTKHYQEDRETRKDGSNKKSLSWEEEKIEARSVNTDEEVRNETVYAIGDQSQDPDEETQVGTKRLQHKKKSAKARSEKESSPKDGETPNDKKEKEEEEVEEEPVIGSKDDLVARLQKQLEMRDKDIALLKEKNNETKVILKSMHNFLLGKGLFEKPVPYPTQQVLTREDIQEIVSNQLRLAGAGVPPLKKTGRPPYPPEFEAIPYRIHRAKVENVLW